MTRTGQSLLYFGFYLFALAATLLFAPNWLLGIFGMPPTSEVWIRVIGMLVLFLGVYDVVAARANLVPIAEASVKARLTVILFFGVFVALGFAPATLLVFAGVDAAGAIWTMLALRSDARR